MPYIILNKSTNGIYAVVENDSHKNEFNTNLYDVKTIDETSFNNIILSLVDVTTNDNGNTFSYVDIKNGPLPYLLSKENFVNYINNLKNNLKNFLESNPNSVIYTKGNVFLNSLNTLNINSINFPLSTTVEEYFKQQNIGFLHPYQIR
jgi:hypothetical protein